MDSGTPETSTTEDAPGDDGGGGDDAMMMAEVMACVPAPVKVDTFDGGSTWSCTQAACADGGLAACAADCTCNTAVFNSLLCVNDAGPAKTVDCFTAQLTAVISDPVVLPFATCLQSPAVSKCAGLPTDGGTDAAKDGGADGGTDTGAPSDAGDGGG